MRRIHIGLQGVEQTGRFWIPAVRLARGDAAIDDKVRAGDEARLLRREEGDAAGARDRESLGGIRGVVVQPPVLVHEGPVHLLGILGEALDLGRALDLPFITEVVLAEVAVLAGTEGPPPPVPFFDNSGPVPTFRRIG